MPRRLVSVDDDFNLPAAVIGPLGGTFVRFEDQDGNPLPTRNVIIKVDSTTGDILDIVSEA